MSFMKNFDGSQYETLPYLFVFETALALTSSKLRMKQPGSSEFALRGTIHHMERSASSD